jgi:hypothetical protein
MKKTEMSSKEFVARIAIYCGLFYCITWAAGFEIRSPSNRATDVFLEATKPGKELLEEGRIEVGGIGSQKIAAWVTHVQLSQYRPMVVKCEFYPSGKVQAHSETAVKLRYVSQVWPYEVTDKIGEEITRCRVFEEAARDVMLEAVSKGVWEAVPEFNYDPAPAWFWRHGLYLSTTIFSKTTPE